MKEKKLWVNVTATFPPELDGFEIYSKHAVFAGNLFSFYLPAVAIKTTSKLIVEFHEKTDVLLIFPKTEGESIYTIRETFDFENFNAIDLNHKLKFLVQKVYQCLIQLYKHIGLNLIDLKYGYDKIAENNYELKINICHSKQNKSRTLKAVVIAEHFLEYSLIYISFFNNDNKSINKIDLFRTIPQQFIYTQLINSAKWIDNEIFSVSNNSKEFTINIKIDGSYTIIYCPHLRDIKSLKEEIRFLTKEIFIDIDKNNLQKTSF